MSKKDLRVTLIGDDQTGKAFGSASKGAEGLGAKFAKFGAVAAAGLGAGVAGLGLFAKSGVDAFARVEDALGGAGVIFGESAHMIESFSNAAARNFGLSKGAALDAMNTFGTLGKAAGLSGQDLALFSTKFTGLAGDMASFKGTSPEQAIEAIGAALRGETEPIRAYGVMLDDAALRQEALRQGLIKTTKDALTPQQKSLAAQALILKQTGDAQGDFSRTSESTANTAKRLAAETENASAKLGQQLAPAVTAAREAFLGLIQGASGLVTKVGPYVAQAQVAFSSFFDALRGGGVTSDGLVGKFEIVGEALHRFGSAAIPVVMAAFDGLVATMTTVGKAVMSTVEFFREHDTAAKALGVVVAAVAAGVAAAWVAQAGVATINAAKSVAAWFVTATASTTSATIQSKSTAQIVVGWAAHAASSAASAAKVVASWVLMGAQAMLGAAKMAAAWLIAMGPIALVIAAVVGLVVVIVKNWDTIRAKTVELWNAVKAATQATWDWIKNAVGSAVSFLTGLFMNFTGPGLLIKHWNTIKTTTAAAFAAVKTTISNALGDVLDIIGDLPGKILGAVRGFGSLLVNAGRELMSGLARGIAQRISDVIDQVQAAAQKIKDLLPGSPVKTGPLTAWNNGGAGKRLMGMLADGIEAGSSLPARAMARAVDFGDVAGMNVGGAGYINSRLASTSSTAPTEKAVSYNVTINGTLDPTLTPDSIIDALRRMELLAPRG